MACRSQRVICVRCIWRHKKHIFGSKRFQPIGRIFSCDHDIVLVAIPIGLTCSPICMVFSPVRTLPLSPKSCRLKLRPCGVYDEAEHRNWIVKCQTSEELRDVFPVLPMLQSYASFSTQPRIVGDNSSFERPIQHQWISQKQLRISYLEQV